MLQYSASPLIQKRILMFRGLDLPVSSPSHFMKLSVPSRSLPLFHDRPRASLVGYLVLIKFLYRGVGSVTSTTSWWGTQNLSHGFPKLFYDGDITLATVISIIL